jgi:Mn2+/Fe2+ NRAMP family transporter
VPAFLYRLARANRTVVFGVAALLLLVALFAPGLVGAVLLLAMAGALFALGTLTWHLQPPATRVARLAILAGLVLIAMIKLTG